MAYEITLAAARRLRRRGQFLRLETPLPLQRCSGPRNLPAVLERLIETPVINAAVEGYGLDQTVLRAETLLKSYNPQAVLLGIFEEDILRTTYSRFEKPKPYFNIVDGMLVRRNSPVRLTFLSIIVSPCGGVLLDEALFWIDYCPCLTIELGGFVTNVRGDPVELGRLLLRRMYQNTRQLVYRSR